MVILRCLSLDYECRTSVEDVNERNTEAPTVENPVESYDEEARELKRSDTEEFGQKEFDQELSKGESSTDDTSDFSWHINRAFFVPGTCATYNPSMISARFQKVLAEIGSLPFDSVIELPYCFDITIAKFFERMFPVRVEFKKVCNCKHVISDVDLEFTYARLNDEGAYIRKTLDCSEVSSAYVSYGSRRKIINFFLDKGHELEDEYFFGYNGFVYVHDIDFDIELVERSPDNRSIPDFLNYLVGARHYGIMRLDIKRWIDKVTSVPRKFGRRVFDFLFEAGYQLTDIPSYCLTEKPACLYFLQQEIFREKVVQKLIEGIRDHYEWDTKNTQEAQDESQEPYIQVGSGELSESSTYSYDSCRTQMKFFDHVSLFRILVEIIKLNLVTDGLRNLDHPLFKLAYQVSPTPMKSVNRVETDVLNEEEQK